MHNAPNTGLTTFKITNDTYRVDDPNSAYYNKRVDGTQNKDWNSAEYMIDHPTEYEYGFVIIILTRYITPVLLFSSMSAINQQPAV